ncbi:SDR family NAD(P)-dependent oxidoreductase [Curtobacterium sp. 24E2]|nr:SDR family NAD(P)-dependent oxidoreductase [Curtobacterium sp. 24E2]
MITDQHPLPTPFTASSTAAEVLDGVDLTGRNVVVTGGHGRLGHEASRALAAAGAVVTIASRDTDRASAAVAGIPGVRVEQLDLTDPASIDAFAARWTASGRPLHALVNNAAMLFTPDRRLDARGNELSFSTSHLGHFRLTRALLPPCWRPVVRGYSTSRPAPPASGRSGGTTRRSPAATTRPPPTGSPSGRTCCSRSNSTAGTPTRASVPSPRTPASSSAPARTTGPGSPRTASRGWSTTTARRSSTPNTARRRSSRGRRRSCSVPRARCSTASAGST